MTGSPKFLLVDSRVAPEVFTRVVYAKQLLAQGKATSSSQAARMAGISRSAYYKYKDCVHRYDEHLHSSLVTLSAVLEDEPGVLSNVLSALYQEGANVITVNQNIPVDGVALVSISVQLRAGVSAGEMIAPLEKVAGVVRVTNL